MSDRLYKAAAQLPGFFWDALSGKDCLLPYYHMVSDEAVPHVSPLYHFRTTADFKRDLDYLLQFRRPLTLSEFVSAVRETGKPPQKSFLMTFDDGFREMHDLVMPLLTAKGVPGTFFLNTSTLDNRELGHHQKIALLLWQREKLGRDFPEKEIKEHLTTAGIPGQDTVAALKTVPWARRDLADQLGILCKLDFDDYVKRERPYVTSTQVTRMLQSNMDIGAHSIDHPLYASISLPEQLRQTRESMAVLVKAFDLQLKAFAFPHTDRGVSADFFSTISREKMVDVSFGTSAPRRDDLKWHFQRFTMEKTTLPAKAIVARNHLRKLRQSLTGNSVITRPATGINGPL